VPPFVGVAVKVTEEPEQVGLLPLVILIPTAGTTTGLMVIVMPFEVAVVGLAQEADEVMTQVIICPFSMDELVYVGLFVPTFAPFNFH